MKNCFLLIVFLVCITESYGQNYLVCDTLKQHEKNIDYIRINKIHGPYIKFIEKNYILKVNKNELINILKSDLDSLVDDYVKLYKIAISYLTKRNDLTFNKIWTNFDTIDHTSIFDSTRLGERNLTIKILKDVTCEIIKKRNFELVVNNKANDYFYFQRVDCSYGGNVDGAFSRENILFWICPPFIID